MRHPSPRGHQPPPGQMTSLDLFHLGEAGSSLSALLLSAPTSMFSQNFTECPSTPPGPASDQGTHLTGKKVQWWVHAHIPLVESQLVGTEKWTGLLKTLLRHSEHPQRKHMLWFNHCTVLYPKARMHGPRNQGAEAELVPLTIIPRNLHAEFLVPILPTPGPADLGRMLTLVPTDQKMTLPLAILGSLYHWTNKVKKEFLRVPRWPSGLRIQHCLCCGMGSIPGLGPSTCCGQGQNKKSSSTD